jgi:hypothetical protein
MRSHALFTVAVLAVAASGQTTDEQAQKAFKADAKSVVKQHKGLLKEDVAALQPNIDQFTAEVKADNFGDTVVQDFFDALQSLQASVITDTDDLSVDVGAVAEAALLNLAGPGGELDGVYPQGFRNGDGGTFDDTEDALAKDLAKTYAGLGKKLAKLPLLAAKRGAGFTVRVLPPQAPTEVMANGDHLGWNAELPLTIDIAIGTSDPLIEHDGALWLGGTAGGLLGNVTVTTTGTGFEIIDQKTAEVDLDTRRWGIRLDGDGAGYAEGNYLVRAQVADAGSRAYANVGVP